MILFVSTLVSLSPGTINLTCYFGIFWSYSLVEFFLLLFIFVPECFKIIFNSSRGQERI